MKKIWTFQWSTGGGYRHWLRVGRFLFGGAFWNCNFLQESTKTDLKTLKIPLFFRKMFPLFFRSVSGVFPEWFRNRPEKERTHFAEKERNLLSFKVRWESAPRAHPESAHWLCKGKLFSFFNPMLDWTSYLNVCLFFVLQRKIFSFSSKDTLYSRLLVCFNSWRTFCENSKIEI